jgi:hypothetical protein
VRSLAVSRRRGEETEQAKVFQLFYHDDAFVSHSFLVLLRDKEKKKNGKTYPSHLRSPRQSITSGSDAARSEGNKKPFLGKPHLV